MSTAASSPIDWRFAGKVAARVTKPGPSLPQAEAKAVVSELRRHAEASIRLVAETTGLVAPPTGATLVVDRRGWVRANSQIFDRVLAPVLTRTEAERSGHRAGARSVTAAKGLGMELGVALGYLSTKVLGQFDSFSEHPRLLLVAPNIVATEQVLRVQPSEFRLWVCLHEETHRTQFGAAPWLRGHVLSLLDELVESLDARGLVEDGGARLLASARGEGSLIDALATPDQRDLIDRLTSVMSLLEGHADVVMDRVGPSVIPSVGRIRAAFDSRRMGRRTVDRFLRRLLGLDLKLAQYRDGAAFVNAVIDKVGMERFNAVFAGAENLPSHGELYDAEAWIKRVL